MSNRKDRWHRGVLIHPKNYCGMYSARVDVPGGGQRLAADTLEGMRQLISETLNNPRRADES